MHGIPSGVSSFSFLRCLWKSSRCAQAEPSPNVLAHHQAIRCRRACKLDRGGGQVSSSITCAAWCVDCGVFAQVQPVFCGECCGRGGFQTRPYGMGNGRSETRPYGMGSAVSPTHTPLRFGQPTLAGYGCSLPKSTSCAWNRTTWLLILTPSPAPGVVRIVAYSHRCNRFSVVCGVVVGAGFKPAPTPRAKSGLKPAPAGQGVEPVPTRCGW